MRAYNLWDSYLELADSSYGRKGFDKPLFESSFVHMPDNKLLRINGIDTRLNPNSPYHTNEYKTYADYFRDIYGIKDIIAD